MRNMSYDVYFIIDTPRKNTPALVLLLAQVFLYFLMFVFYGGIFGALVSVDICYLFVRYGKMRIALLLRR
ncbi:MAG: hypothetical protein LBJ67_12715 [Planctomycetaceae bacterium]|nr:hypothetical protein [Planctomycetaceae bacterium]